MTIIRGRVNDAGRFNVHVDDDGLMRAALGMLVGKNIEIEIREWHPKRSYQANKYYWGCVLPAVADELSRQMRLPLPMHPKVAHHLLKAAFIGIEESEEGVEPLSSAALDSRAFNLYIERIRSHAAAEWGLNIPDPGEHLALPEGE